MDADELRRQLKTVLPDGHPFITTFDREVGIVVSVTDGESKLDDFDWLGMLTRVLCTLDDWKRGIRNWDEVEREIRDARDAILVETVGITDRQVSNN